MDSDFPDLMDSVGQTAALSGMFNILITVVCIWAAWWALQGFRFDVFMKNPRGPQAKLIMILISVIIGHAAARFIIDYLEWSLLLKWLV